MSPPAGQPPAPQPAWHRAQVEAVTRPALVTPRPTAHPGQPGAWAHHQYYSPSYVPAQARPNPTQRPQARRWVLTGLVAFLSVVMGLVFALLFGLSFGLVATLLALVFALIPLVFVVPVFVWLDRFHAEPVRYLVTAFLYGALGSTFIALFLNALFGGVLSVLVTDPESAGKLSPVLIAPPVEETFKGLFVLGMWAFTQRRFNGLTDGVVYAGIVAAGFACTENVLYLGEALTQYGREQFVRTFVMRGLLSPFAHPMFTSMIGIGIGIAASSRATHVRVIAPFVGWCAALLLHGLWNFGAVVGLGSGDTGVVITLATGFITFCVYVGFIIWTRRREARTIGRHLRPYAATGWLSPAEVGMLSSMRERRQARSWAKRTGGARSVGAMRAFQDSASELALLRYRMVRQSADQESLRTERVLLDSMTARRRQFAGLA